MTTESPAATKVWGLMVMQPSQKPLIDKHCFGDCGKISMAGAISDPLTGSSGKPRPSGRGGCQVNAAQNIARRGLAALAEGALA